MKISGSCLCHKITFTVEGRVSRFAMCYYSRCRKATGSAHASNLFVEANQVDWLTGEENICRYELPEAERFSRAFCGSCGSPVPCLGRDKLRYVIPAGCLDSDPGVRPDVKIYVAHKAPWYQDLEAAEEFDGPPQ